jgi:endoglucanase
MRSYWTLPLCFIASLACVPKAAPAADAASVPRPEVVHRCEPVPGFMRGINLGNGLDAPQEGAWGVVLGERHFEMAKAAGLDHVRLPVRFSTRAAAAAPYTIDPKFFERVDWAVQQALSRQLNVIIDLHHYEEIMAAPDAHAERFLALWKQIAEHYAGAPPQVAFELLNEPSKELDPSRYNALIAKALPIVRAKNPTRIVYVNSYFWASADYLKSLTLPGDDPNVVASFHMYQPILFTHQGASWMDPEYQTQGLVFPGPPAKPVTPVPAAQKVGWVKDWFDGYNQLPIAKNPGGPSTVYAHFRTAAEYAKAQGKRVYLGEFGAIDNADPKSRETYIRLVRTEAERHGFGWAYWDDGGKNRAMNVADGSWVPFIRSALLD